MKMMLSFIFAFILTVPVYAQSFFVKTIETEMLEAVNKIRTEHSLPPLTQNWEATRVAKYKSEEMMNLNYSSHNSPVYGSPADMLNRYEIPFSMVGENISAGSLDINAAVGEWMDVSAYRDNILNGAYKEIGIGYSKNKSSEDSFWVLLFIM